ncbi:MAG TPA: F0F1 ATP synthase subunit B [Streptosporangiaceae bacterium]|nr:F0F1 ATP synthase subunit B [Streptosporangiaceae bacterium]
MYLADSSLGPLSPSVSELIIGTISFLIVFAALWRILLPRIQQTLTERTDQIEGGLQRAEEAQREAKQTLEQYQAQLAEARHEASRLRQEAQEEGARILAELRERGEAERQRLVAAAHEQIEADRAQAIQALRTEMGALAVELASRVVGEALDQDARQRRVIDRFLEELEGEQVASESGS